MDLRFSAFSGAHGTTSLGVGDDFYSDVLIYENNC